MASPLCCGGQAGWRLDQVQVDTQYRISRGVAEVIVPETNGLTVEEVEKLKVEAAITR